MTPDQNPPIPYHDHQGGSSHSRDTLCRENAVRQIVHATVLRRPGNTAAEVARLSGLNYSTVRYHLYRLRRADHVRHRQIHGQSRWFPVHAAYGVLENQTAAACRNPTQRQMLKALDLEPGISAGRLADRLGVKKSTASYHLKRLVTLGILENHRDGRIIRYQLKPGIEDALSLVIKTA